MLYSSRSACIDPEVKCQGHTVTKTVTVARLLVSMSGIPHTNTPLCYLQPLPAWVCMSIRLPMFSSYLLLGLARLHMMWGGGRLVSVAGVCSRLSSSSLTLHGGPAGGGQAMTSCGLQSNYSSTAARGPVVLRPDTSLSVLAEVECLVVM